VQPPGEPVLRTTLLASADLRHRWDLGAAVDEPKPPARDAWDRCDWCESLSDRCRVVAMGH